MWIENLMVMANVQWYERNIFLEPLLQLLRSRLAWFCMESYCFRLYPYIFNLQKVRFRH